MIFSDRDDAKDFFVNRLEEQARLDGEALTPVEIQMLKWTETYPIRGISPDELPVVQEEFSAGHDDAEFEKRITSMLRSAYARDKEAMGEDYQSAYHLLAGEDHYLNVMLQPALGGVLRKKFLGLF